MSFVTTEQVLAYVGSCAESMIEDDTDEDGTWTQDEFEELQERALKLVHRLQYGGTL